LKIERESQFNTAGGSRMQLVILIGSPKRNVLQ